MCRLPRCLTKPDVSGVEQTQVCFFFLVCLSLHFCLFLFSRRHTASLSVFFSTLANTEKLRAFCLIWFFFICLFVFFVCIFACFFWDPGISQRRRSRGLVFLLFLLHIPGTKHCAESAPIVAIHWQQYGRWWERPGILPGCADLRNEDRTRSSPEPKG